MNLLRYFNSASTVASTNIRTQRESQAETSSQENGDITGREGGFIGRGGGFLRFSF